jgi:hypothetical protein
MVVKIDNVEFNVEWLKSMTLAKAKKLKIPNIELAWKMANAKPKKTEGGE